MTILKEITSLLTTAQLDEAIVRIVMKNKEPQVIVQFSVNGSNSVNITEKEKALRSALCLPLICSGNESELTIIENLRSLSEPLSAVVGGITALNIGNSIKAQAESAVIQVTKEKKPKKKKVTPVAPKEKNNTSETVPPVVVSEETKPTEPVMRIEDLDMDSLFSTDSTFLIK